MMFLLSSDFNLHLEPPQNLRLASKGTGFREDRSIQTGRFLGLGVEPQEWGDPLHG